MGGTATAVSIQVFAAQLKRRTLPVAAAPSDNPAAGSASADNKTA